MRRFLLAVLLFLGLVGTASAALHFPALTGRVVDEAGILSAPARETLEQKLAAFEEQTTDQVVVVTLQSLEGDAIEDYGYQLGRAWGIGQKGKNNGVLLIVAPHERKVRIEVGYGLEEVLTDAASKYIIENEILPDFHSGHMEQGVMKGAIAILAVLGGDASVATVGAHTAQHAGSPWVNLGVLLIWLVIILVLHFAFGVPFFLLIGGGRWSGGSGGSSGGFSGGGGSFGGGGASSGW